MTTQIFIGGQLGWEHTDEHGAGYFHTYDALKLSEQTPHKMHIWLPKEYATNDRKRYSALYMLDGATAFWPGGLLNKSLNVSRSLGELIRADLISPLIVIAIHPTDRAYQYTHQDNYRDNHFRGGGIFQYSDYIANVLKPWIDKHYHTNPIAEKSVIQGASFGGLASFLIGSQHPAKFGKAVCESASFYVGDGIHGLEDSTLFKICESTLRHKDSRPVFWIDWGISNDPENPDCTDMIEQLTTNFHYEIDKDLFIWEDKIGGHNEDAWAYRMKLVLQKFFPKE